MSQLLNPYLHRPGDAREVAEFYRDVFGGELRLLTFDQGGMPIADGWGDKVMHAQLTTRAGFTIMVSDTPPGHETAHGEDVSIMLSGTDAQGLRLYWDALTVGATVTQPLGKAPWGDWYGACYDRFGTSWQINVSDDAE